MRPGEVLLFRLHSLGARAAYTAIALPLPKRLAGHGMN